MKNLKRENLMKKIAAGNLMLQIFITKNAYAALPWEDPLDTVVESLTGPVAQGISVIACVVMGGLLAFGELGGVAKRGIMILFGIAMALFATNFITAIGG
jgi:type IV secretory pathway VirB2 component (pilin)